MFLFGIFILMMVLFPFVIYLNNIRFRNNNIIRFYLLVGLVILIIFSGAVFFALVHEVKIMEKRESLMNGLIKVYMPTSLGNEWRIISNSLTSDNGFRKIEYFQLYGRKKINIAEIKNPETDLKCSNETFVELDEIFPLSYLFPVSEELWMKNCEELSTYGKKSVLSEDKKHNYRHFLMVFDKGNTRILLDYFDQLTESLSNTQGLSKSELIRVAENLRPVEKKDFGL